MRIDQSTSNPVQSTDAQGAQGAKKTGKSHHPAKKAHDPHAHFHRASEAAISEVSSRAKEMVAARAAAAEAPDEREDKIADIKARIAGGRYHVDSKAIADRLVDDHIRMSGIG